ncbi:MAG: hypothetical protein HGA87_01185 [Desulfobulbaceae bacterium]|nr:hypothetical protein [Desulfobulbaceae bacterium]
MRDYTITRAAAVTPSDTANLPASGIGLYVGVSGNVAIVTTGGSSVTLVGLAAGMWHPIQCKQIKSTLTTATSILVGW